MSAESGVLAGLTVYCVIREVFFIYSTNKLLNKLMSRNYHEFAYTEAQTKIKPVHQDSFTQDDSSFSEDLGALTGIG